MLKLKMHSAVLIKHIYTVFGNNFTSVQLHFTLWWTCYLSRAYPASHTMIAGAGHQLSNNEMIKQVKKMDGLIHF